MNEQDHYLDAPVPYVPVDVTERDKSMYELAVETHRMVSEMYAAFQYAQEELPKVVAKFQGNPMLKMMLG